MGTSERKKILRHLKIHGYTEHTEKGAGIPAGDFLSFLLDKEHYTQYYSKTIVVVIFFVGEGDNDIAVLTYADGTISQGSVLFEKDTLADEKLGSQFAAIKALINGLEMMTALSEIMKPANDDSEKE